MRTKGSAAELERRRRQAVGLLKKGHKPIRVAEMLGVSPAAVTRWKQAHQKGGDEALVAKSHPGGKSRLTPAQRRRLEQLLLKKARAHGYSTDLWTLQRVADVIAMNFGVEYHVGHVWKILRAMGWSCQKPERRGRERDEQAIADWRKNQWPRIKKSAERRPKHRIR